MTTPTDTSSPHVADYGAVLRRRALIVLVCTLLGALIAGGYTAKQKKSYDSTTAVQINPLVSDPFSNTGNKISDLINPDTEAQLVTSATVGQIAAKTLDYHGKLSQLTKKVSVTVPANTQVLQITFSGGTALKAQRGSDAFARAYLTNRGAQAQATKQDQINSLNKQISDLSAQLSKLSGQVASLPANSPDKILAQSQQSVVSSQLNQANTRLASLTTLVLTPGSIITAANLPSKPSTPIIPLNLGAGIMLGLLVGIGLAFLLDRRDKSAHSVADIERQVEAPVLVELPVTARGRRAADAPGLVQSTDPAAAVYRSLRGVVAPPNSGEDGRVLVVTSAGEDGNAGAVAANLAATLSRSSAKVVLISADFTRSVSGRILSLQPEPGLADVLERRANLSEVVQRPAVAPQLTSISSGRALDNASEMLQAQLLADLMTSLRHSHDYIIVEAAPATRGSDAQSVAALADATLLVVQKESAQMDRLAVIRQMFKRVAAPVRGIILTHGTLPTGPSPSPLGTGGSPAALSSAVGATSDA